MSLKDRIGELGKVEEYVEFSKSLMLEVKKRFEELE
jgi:hypothetical protein